MPRRKTPRPHQHNADNPFLETSGQHENGEYIAYPKSLKTRRQRTINERVIEQVRFDMPSSTATFFRERAAILGVGFATLMKDVLTLYATLVVKAEQKAGIEFGQTKYTNDIPQRTPGYRELLVPAGSSSPHDTPLGLEEL